MTDFAAWLEAREPALRQTAYALTGDAARSRSLVREAAVAASASVHTEGSSLEDAARTAMASELPPTPAGSDEPVVWDYLSSLEPRDRVDAVLGLLDAAPGSARAVDDLAGLLAVDAAEARARTLHALARASADLPARTTYADVVGLRRRRRTRRRTGMLLAAAAVAAVAVPTLALTGGGLPDPAEPSRPTQTPAVGAGEREAREPFPPPWVLPPDVRRQLIGGTTRVQIETNCANPADEEFRSLTVIRARCRTEVVKQR